MPLTPEQRRENGRRGAKKRWGDTTAEDRTKAAQAMVAGRTEKSRIKRLQTEADNMGYRLVPKDRESDDG